MTNLICVGDSNIEMDAAHTLGKEFSQSLVKTIKFREGPKPEELVKQQELVTDRLEQIFMNSKNLTIKLEKKQKESKGDDRKSGASKGSEGTAESDNKAPDSPKISKLLVGQSTNKMKAETKVETKAETPSGLPGPN